MEQCLMEARTRLFQRHVFSHVHAKQVGSGRPGEGSGRLAISSKDGAKGPLAVTQVGCDTCTCCVCHVLQLSLLYTCA